VAACASLANSLLQACPDLHILATSREALGIEAERTYLVPSLSFPESGHAISLEELAKFEAVDLFTRRAKAVLPGFELNEENAKAVTEICRHLDGIPLALELAAARVKLMDLEQIASQLGDRFQLLTGGDRTALPRLQTMRASIDWSYHLLTQAEKVLLRRLSVFAGGWSLAAAKAICADEALPETNILDLLGGLVNKSLVLVRRKRGQEIRYYLLETVRQYAAEKFEKNRNNKTLRNRHLAYYVSFVEQAADGFDGPNPGEWIRRLDNEIDNLRLSLGWSLANDVEAGLRLAIAVGLYWEDRGYASELRGWLDKLLECTDAKTSPQLYARAVGTQGAILINLGEKVQAQACAQKSLALCHELGDQRGEAFSLSCLGYLAEDTFSTRSFLEKSLALFRIIGDKVRQADMLARLSYTYTNVGGLDRIYAEESLALYRESNHQIGVARGLGRLAEIDQRNGDYESVQQGIEEALIIQEKLGIRIEYASNLIILGRLAFRQGKYDKACAILKEAIAICDETGHVSGFWGRAFLAYIFIQQGKTRLARSEFEECLNWTRLPMQYLWMKTGVVFVIEGLASLMIRQGQPEHAASLLAWADEMRRTMGAIRPVDEQAYVDRDLAAIRLQLDEPALQAAQAAGRAMTLEEAIAFALSDQDG
jgi:predicted ATPase